MPTKTLEPINNLAFEKAREAIIVLGTISTFLDSNAKETLEILMDKNLMNDLEKSLQDTNANRVSKLETILE